MSKPVPDGRRLAPRQRPAPQPGRHRPPAAALRGFERSIVALRTAALDHVDSQDLASLTLRALLDRRSGREWTA